MTKPSIFDMIPEGIIRNDLSSDFIIFLNHSIIYTDKYNK